MYYNKKSTEKNVCMPVTLNEKNREMEFVAKKKRQNEERLDQKINYCNYWTKL